VFRTVPLIIIRNFSPYTQQWYMSYRFADSLRAGSGRTSWSSPKHAEFYSKNIFEKLVHLFGFIIRTREKLHALHVEYIEAAENSVAHRNFHRLFGKS